MQIARKLLCIALAFSGLLTGPSRAHAQAASTSEKAASDIDVAPVMVDGRTLFRIRGASAYPAELRAQTVSEHIEAVARDRAFDVKDIRVNETPYSTQIVAGNMVIITLFDGDAQLEQVRREGLATADVLRIQQAVGDYRRERQPGELAHRALLAGAAAVGLLLLWVCALRIVGPLIRALERRYKHRMREVGIQSLKLLPADRIWMSLVGVVRLAAAATGLAAAYVALDYILSLFPWTRQISQNLSGFILDPLRTMGRKFVDSIPNLMFLVILAVVVYYLLKFIRLIFAAVENGAVTIGGFDPTWAKPTSRLVKVFVIAFALVVAFPYIPGSNTQALKASLCLSVSSFPWDRHH
jgi:hypothetical protein